LTARTCRATLGPHDKYEGLRMTSRRQFLQGATLAAVPLVTGLPRIADAGMGTSLAFQAVLIDDRHAEARAFGAALAARGSRVMPVPHGDVTAPWLGEIGPAWRRAPVPVAGLTRPPVLFCLEQLAWAQGLRVVFHAEHVVTLTRTASHAVHACASGGVGFDAGDLARRGRLWPWQVADTVARFDASRRDGRAGPSCAGLMPALPADAELLTSWIIAPV
jgi:hypothetical protein